jgi:hypothetical protein
MAQYRSGEIEPVYLTLADVLELHALIIGATASEAADQLAHRSLGPRTGRLDPQLQQRRDTGGGCQARDLGDAQHRIAAGRLRTTDAVSMGPQRTAAETQILSGRHAPDDDP